MAAPNAKLAGRLDRHARDRAILVARHFAARGMRDPLVLAAMGTVPREAFEPEHLADFAYEDSALPIEAGADHLPALHCRAHDRACLS
jgi:protein-L-isoaspartate O-methyltransferase